MSETSLRGSTDRTAIKPPRVSVILIFLDAESFISQAIESVLDQTYDDWELILVDDGSYDGSVTIASAYAERYPHIHYLDHVGHSNKGMSASRNLGLSVARGEFAAFIDADDIWSREKLTEQVAIMDANRDVALVAGAVRSQGTRIRGALDINREQIRNIGHVQDRVIHPPEALIRIYPLGPFSGPCPSDLLIRMRAIAQVGGFENEFRGYGEDAVFLTKLLLRFPVYFASRNWFLYRLNPGSSTAKMLAEGTGRQELARVLSWIENYVRSQATPPPAVVNKIAWRLLSIRYPVLDYPRCWGKKILPANARRRLRTILNQFEIFLSR